MKSEQIAKLAGVSRSTVSKVLHNYPEIPEVTRQKVLKIVQEQGYRPNVMSQALKGFSPKVIGVYFFARVNEDHYYEVINTHYDGSLLRSITMEAKKRDYSIMYDVILSSEPVDKVVANINNAFASHSISLAVFIGLDNGCDFIDDIAYTGRHVIVIDKECDTSKGIRTLFCNNFNAAITACNHLKDNGFAKIMHVAGDLGKHSGRMRRDGYLSFIANHKDQPGFDYEPLVMPGTFSMEHGYRIGIRFLEEKLYERYNGIMCGCDMIAVGFLKCIRESKPDLVDQLGIIGFDNEVIDRYVSPAISTLTVDYRNFARFIFDLEQNYDNFEGGLSVQIEQELIVRDSSRPAAKRNYDNIPIAELIKVN